MVEFDENKSAVNKAKHGIDFKTATRLWDDPYRIVIPARVVDEPRYIMIAMLGRSLLVCCIYSSK
jgi:uncharacterized DUF497 family protein